MNSSRFADVNAAVAGYLRDLAYARMGAARCTGDKRTAAAIMSLDTPLTRLAAAGPLPRIPAEHRPRVAARHSGSARYK